MAMRNKMSRGALILFILVYCTGCGQAPATYYKDGVVNGISLVAPAHAIDSSDFLQLKKLHTNWVALIPYAFGKQDSAVLYYNSKWQWWGEQAKGIAACTRMAHALNMHILLKPQVWYHHGFSGSFHLTNEKDWEKWENNYRRFILYFAKMADSLHIEMLCMGTEWDRATRERPDFWRSMVDTIRKVYHGKLTYAANWDAYLDFPAWDKLDFIGINAYFPISNAKTPQIKDLKKAWKPIVKKISRLAQKFQKPILFTEYGYRSIDYTAQAPWESETRHAINNQAQAIALEAFYQIFYREPWFAGGFLWKWYSSSSHFHRHDATSYTLQNKPAEKVILKWFGETNH